jgi:predicted dithiol-disulfide oxidoreductase (DUF899 family)
MTRARDALAEKRRALPWVKVDKAYRFDTPEGRRPWPSCSAASAQLHRLPLHVRARLRRPAASAARSWSITLNGIIPHLEQKDVAFVAVSRAPLARLEAFKRRMGWSFRWVSSGAAPSTTTYGVSFTPSS